MNAWTWAAAAWLGMGALALSWYWYEAGGNVHRSWGMRVAELVLGPLLWPLGLASTWIWWKSRRERVLGFRRTGTPHCPRHGHILLKCEAAEHEAFCSGCSGACVVCRRGAWFSPRYHGQSTTGEPIIVYERIYAERPEWMQERV